MASRVFKTGVKGKEEKVFKLSFSERIYRLHPHGVENHAPVKGGVYELVIFRPGDEDGTILYVGREDIEGSIALALDGIMKGEGPLDPAQSAEVEKERANLYFDAVMLSDCGSNEDWQDLAWALVQDKKPGLNDLAAQQHSGRWSAIGYEEFPGVPDGLESTLNER